MAKKRPELWELALDADDDKRALELLRLGGTKATHPYDFLDLAKVSLKRKFLDRAEDLAKKVFDITNDSHFIEEAQQILKGVKKQKSQDKKRLKQVQALNEQSLRETNGKYNIFPKNQEEFTKAAFEDKHVIVKVIHPDGHVEWLDREVRKVWEADVYWNIETMYSKRTGTKLNEIAGLTVYACPKRYEDVIP